MGSEHSRWRTNGSEITKATVHPAVVSSSGTPGNGCEPNGESSPGIELWRPVLGMGCEGNQVHCDGVLGLDRAVPGRVTQAKYCMFL